MNVTLGDCCLLVMQCATSLEHDHSLWCSQDHTLQQPHCKILRFQSDDKAGLRNQETPQCFSSFDEGSRAVCGIILHQAKIQGHPSIQSTCKNINLLCICYKSQLLANLPYGVWKIATLSIECILFSSARHSLVRDQCYSENETHFPMLAFDCKQVRQVSANFPDKCSLQACAQQ